MYENIVKPEDILTLKRDDVTLDLFLYLFGNRKEGPRFDKNTVITVKKGTYYTLDKDIKTSMGNYLVNLAIFNENIFNVVGFINKKITKDVMEGFQDKIAKALLIDKITVKDTIDYLVSIQFIGFGLNDVIVSSLTDKTVFMPDALTKLKSDLAKKYKDQLAKGDPVIANVIEKELIAKAKEYMKGDPGMDLYESGSKATISNNFKALFLMKGAMPKPDGSGYDVSLTNYMEGIKKDEMEHFANAMVSSAYATGVGTQVGGYLVKRYMAAFQSITLGDPKSDCNTQKTLLINLTNKNYKLFLYRYINVKGKKLLLDDNNVKSYIGRVVNMYDPLYCTSDCICNKCAGDMYYKLGIRNLGLTASKIGSSIMNKSLKRKHDTSIHIYAVKSADELVL